MKLVPTLRKSACALGLMSGALCLLGTQAHAASIDNGFVVKVSVLPAGSSGGSGAGSGGGSTGSGLPPNFGFCRNSSIAGAFGASVTVVCSTGAVVDLAPGRRTIPWAPMHGGAFRYVTQAYWNGEWIDSMDNPPGTGTITSWRLVRLSDRNFLELTVGW